ncbi:putative RND superfamily exporter protein [Epilithonimonas hungarica]|uniref:hypothetical protein n=1 Tax=Epilithonimonas hungarica TaxID=454006 RepID=UPI00278840E4|nr:hypothetical protein [Epilithonimonas hungarica]MDP9954714.1 putative RND superfamily exporter protein [Epilithonimonas hungarica]
MKTKFTKDSDYPGKQYQELHDHMFEEHGLILLESQMQDIIHIVNKMQSPDREEEMIQMLERIIKDFEGDYVLDGEIVDKPYEWIIDRYKEAKSLLQSLKQ